MSHLSNSGGSPSKNNLMSVGSLGLLWGLCIPLLFSIKPAAVLFMMVFSIPISVAALFFVWLVCWRIMEKGGLSRAAAKAKAVYILTPQWIISFAPASLLLPILALPYWLGFIAVSLSVYRFVAAVRELFFSNRAATLEQGVFFAVFLVGTVAFFQVNIVHDAFQYYGYLASVAVDHDLNLYNQIYINNTHRFYNPFPKESARYIGTALMEAPFFALGHISALALNALGEFNAMNGYSFPYLFWVSLASGFFGLAGVIVCYFWTREYFSRRISMMAVIGVWLASPLVFFMFSWNGWAHPFSFFFASLFLLLWHRTRGQRRVGHWLLLGIIGGAICLIRPSDGLVFLFPFCEWLLSLRKKSPALPQALNSKIIGPGLFVLLIIIVFTPQLSLWKGISGHWLPSPYKEVGDHFDWLHPNFYGILFSAAQHGLFTWTPLLLPAALGIPLLGKKDRVAAIVSGIVVLFTIYQYASWSIWWTGIGFSNRFFIILTPYFILGLAALINRLQKWISAEFVWGLLSFAIIWNIFLIGEYRTNIIPVGIPGPFRVVDDPLTLGRIVYCHLAVFPKYFYYLFLAWWDNHNFFADRLIHAVQFRNPLEIISTLLILAAVGLMGFYLIKLLFNKKFREFLTGNAVVLVIVTLSLTIFVHAVIRAAAQNTEPFRNFYRFAAVNLPVRQPAEDTYLYCDYPLPVTSVDILSYLIYGQAVPQNVAVASVTVYDQSDREFTKLLRAGVDTAENSFLRPEYVLDLQHKLKGTDIVRQIPSTTYSSYVYDSLTFRSVLDLPEPVVVKKIKLRYLYNSGELIVADIFLRNF